MKKILVSLALMGSAFVAGCSGSGGSSGSSGIANCNADTDCPTGNVCNTAGHVCMQTCTQGSDCPDTQKNCDLVPATAGAAGTPLSSKVCQCSTDALCGGGSTYCDSTTDFICEVTCSDNSGCQGYTDANRICTGGHCVIGVADAGPTACTATSCGADETCDSATGKCVTTDAGPGSCGTAGTAGNCTGGTQYCDGTTCQTPSSCTGPGSETANSPFIWQGAAPTSALDATDCTGGDNMIWTFTYNYYTQGTGTSMPQHGSSTSLTALYQNLYYLTSSGALPTGSLPGNTATNNVAITGTTDGTFTFQLCSDLSGTAVAVAIKDSNGDVSNAACLPTF